MKRIVSIVLAGLLCVSSSLVFACPLVDAGTKILTSPLKIYTNVTEETPKGKVPVLGFVGGLFKGIVEMGGDIVTGVYDIVVSPAKICKKSSCCMTK